MQKDVGAVEFTDLDSLLPALISVSRRPAGGLGIWIDQNNSSEGGWGGDCDVGFDQAGALRFEEILEESHRIARSGPSKGWEPVGSVGYTWCDQDEEPGVALGEVCVIARRGVVRISVQSGRSMWPPYDLTLPIDRLEQLMEFIRRAVAPH